VSIRHHSEIENEAVIHPVPGQFQPVGNHRLFACSAQSSFPIMCCFSCLLPFPPASFASPPSVAFRQRGTMSALTPHGLRALALPSPCACASARVSAPPGGIRRLLSRGPSPRVFVAGAVRSPRVTHTAVSHPRRPAQPSRSGPGTVHSPRSAGGFTIPSRLAVTRRPYLRVHFRCGSDVCFQPSALPSLGLHCFQLSRPRTIDGSRTLYRQVVCAAGRTRGDPVGRPFENEPRDKMDSILLKAGIPRAIEQV